MWPLDVAAAPRSHCRAVDYLTVGFSAWVRWNGTSDWFTHRRALPWLDTCVSGWEERGLSSLSAQTQLTLPGTTNTCPRTLDWDVTANRRNTASFSGIYFLSAAWWERTGGGSSWPCRSVGLQRFSAWFLPCAQWKVGVRKMEQWMFRWCRMKTWIIHELTVAKTELPCQLTSIIRVESFRVRCACLGFNGCSTSELFFRVELCSLWV